ncbi:helix-turn-helix domain-containing protein [Nocardia iowensis]|uniref:helix-turn-helix domain-containing protein n=1 Tax=Nocardia iowensis TaxID=204891 RepID=UPI001FE70D5F|nr:helix-turn-helix transcriptional regulator [Nocardia iowensis]
MDHDHRPVGELLREWRLRRGLSQLELSIQADISTRHVSFVETGRTIPSAVMVERFAEQLNIPLRERNRLLVAAGHAPVYRERAPDDPELTRARAAIRRVLDVHEPYPALAVDRRWNLLFANTATRVFFDDVDPALLRKPTNMMRLGLHPKGFARRLRNLDQVRGFLLPRLARQAAQTGDPDLRALYDELSSYYPAAESIPIDPAQVALPIRIRHGGTDLCFFNTITTFGAPFDITLDEIAVEAYFPSDATTSDYLYALARETAAEPTAVEG